MGGVAATVVALLCAAPCSSFAQSGDIQFLESDPITVNITQLRAKSSSWQQTVEVLNANSSSKEVRLLVRGDVASSFKVSPSENRLVGAGQVAVFRLSRGGDPEVGDAELVLVSSAGLSRRKLVVEPDHWAGIVAKLRSLGPFGLYAALVLTVVSLLTRQRQSPARSLLGREERLRADTIPYSDEPTCLDQLDRGDYVVELARIATNSDPPLVVGVFGDWGSGKSSLLKQLYVHLEKAPEVARVWFDPWQYQHEAIPVLPLIHTMVEQVGLARGRNLQRRISVLSRALGSMTWPVGKLSVNDLARSIQEYDEANFQARSEQVRLSMHFATLIGETLRATKTSRLVFFIDDLDRCLPARVVSLLEALKLHLNHPRCVFFLAVDEARLVRLVASATGSDLGLHGEATYLDKMIQIPFAIPEVPDKTFDAYLARLLPDHLIQALPLLSRGLDKNPRNAKRFTNLLAMHDTLAQKRGLKPYDVGILALVLMLQRHRPAFFAKLQDDPSALRTIADDLEGSAATDEPYVTALLTALGDLGRIPDTVQPYISLTALTTSFLGPAGGTAAPDGEPARPVPVSADAEASGSEPAVAVSRDPLIQPGSQSRDTGFSEESRRAMIAAVVREVGRDLPAVDRLERRLLLRQDLVTDPQPLGVSADSSSRSTEAPLSRAQGPVVL